MAQQWELEFWKKKDANWVTPTPLNKLRHWFKIALRSNQFSHEQDDWNYWWQSKFANYSFLPPVIDDLLELGCGPYTNARLIRQICKIGHITCTDPLASEYIHFKHSWLARAFAARQVEVVQHPAEDVPFLSNSFGCTVMVNVLDHVRDSLACLSEAIRVTESDGFFILGQDLTNEEDIKKIENALDIGHPIRLEHELINQIILPNFIPIIHSILPREQGRAPQFHYGTFIFVGRKLDH